MTSIGWDGLDKLILGVILKLHKAQLTKVRIIFCQ